MIRLCERPGYYAGISLKYCGLLFFSTPHFGYKLADQNKSFVRAADAIIRTRLDDFVNILRTASEVSAESRRKIETLSAMPPFFCLCEGKKTDPAPLSKTVSLILPAIQVVTQESASLAGQTATLMEGCDHRTVARTVARFANKFEPGYRLVVDSLGKTKQVLRGLETQTSFFPNNVRTALLPNQWPHRVYKTLIKRIGRCQGTPQPPHHSNPLTRCSTKATIYLGETTCGAEKPSTAT